MASNYEKSVYKQLEETLKRFDIVVEENKQIKNKIEVLEARHCKEIKELKSEIVMLGVKHQNEVNTLNTKINKLTDENQNLKDIINKDSGNSSKPPSSIISEFFTLGYLFLFLGHFILCTYRDF